MAHHNDLIGHNTTPDRNKPNPSPNRPHAAEPTRKALVTRESNFNNFCAVDLPLPPAREQRSIAVALGRATANIGTAITCSRRQIHLVQEYRRRLIADVVTGKLDVREAAAHLPDEADDQGPVEEGGPMADGLDEEIYDAEEDPAIAEEVRI